MAYDGTFTPLLGGVTILVGVTALQIQKSTSTPTQQTSYRVRCLVTGYLGWAAPVAGNPDAVPPATSIAAATPDATGKVNVIGMTAGQTETFGFPDMSWFISSNAAGFEITAGEGI